MAYNTKVDAEYVRKFADRMKARNSQQDALDKDVLALEQLENRIAVATKPGSNEVTPLHMGLWRQLVMRDAAGLTVESFIKFIEPDPTSQEDKEHSALLEAFVNSAVRKSRETPALIELNRRDLVGKGRAWNWTGPVPQIWATEEIEAKTKEYQDEEDLKKKEELAAELASMKRDNWPIVDRYVNPIGTWTYFGGRHWLPEVVECRKLPCDSIQDEYDIDCGCAKKDSEHDCYVYANWVCCATVICTGSKNAQSTLANYYEHHLNKNPYSLAEANVDESGPVRWRSHLIHARNKMEKLDELLSDISTNTHKAALGHIMQIFKRDEYPEEMIESGRPKVVPLDPGGVTAWWDINDVKQAPVPEITEEVWRLASFLYNDIIRTAMTPVEQGETKSGDTGVQITTAYQIAQRRFNPYLDAIGAQDEDKALTIMRCPAALNYMYPDSLDPLTIFDQYKNKGAISVTPRDMTGWEQARVARLEPAIPVDRYRQISNAAGLRDLGFSRQTVYAEAGVEDPETEIRNANRQLMLDAAIQQVGIPAALQLASSKLVEATPEAMQAISQMLPNASPPLQQALGAAGIGNGTTSGQPTSPESQSMANIRRQNIPQAPQGTSVA